MRTIKFRAWDGKKMHKNLWYITMKGVAVSETSNKPILNPILMQWTGLVDKNGKEIYEDDIAKTNYGKVGVIKYHAERAAYIVHDPDHFNEFLYHEYNVEVIGNIHEHPELLKQ